MCNLKQQNKWINKTKQKQTHGNRDQSDGYQKGGDGAMGEKVKGNIPHNVVSGLHSDRWLLVLELHTHSHMHTQNWGVHDFQSWRFLWLFYSQKYHRKHKYFLNQMIISQVI